MPSLSFVLPHWLYWSGLVVFPLLAMYLVRRAAAHPRRGGLSLPIAYLFLVTCGFVGIHRFYLRSRLGFLYLPLFGAILYCNAQFRSFRNAVSKARHDLSGADFMVERAQNALAAGEAGAAEELARARADLDAAQVKLADLTGSLEFWDAAALAIVLAIGVALLIDAVALPRLFRRCREKEPEDRRHGPAAAMPTTVIPPQPERVGSPASAPGNRLADAIDRLSGFTGHFVCYWSVIAVFVYYYEVLARYVFNSPTNWAHEAMFLMFGMQYLISGAFAYREDAHVRVDVLYSRLGVRARALVDIATSVFFFIFASALLWTSWTFMMDSIGVWEVSFTEWAIQYWPVKMMMTLGAVLITLQGVSKLLKDFAILARTGR